jgi:hypothetical protein
VRLNDKHAGTCTLATSQTPPIHRSERGRPDRAGFNGERAADRPPAPFTREFCHPGNDFVIQIRFYVTDDDRNRIIIAELGFL